MNNPQNQPDPSETKKPLDNLAHSDGVEILRGGREYLQAPNKEDVNGRLAVPNTHSEIVVLSIYNLLADISGTLKSEGKLTKEGVIVELSAKLAPPVAVITPEFFTDNDPRVIEDAVKHPQLGQVFSADLNADEITEIMKSLGSLLNDAKKEDRYFPMRSRRLYRFQCADEICPLALFREFLKDNNLEIDVEMSRHTMSLDDVVPMMCSLKLENFKRLKT